VLSGFEVTAVIDVHAPNEPVMNWRDFFIHLVTITIGLLIALSLEGCVEWQHHRHLVHDAEASLQAEIRNNAKGLPDTMNALHVEQGVLKQDLGVLHEIQKTHKVPHDSSISVNFSIHGFEDVGWKTAQSTGAFSYMPYDRAQEYSDIYESQDSLKESERVAARDAILALSPFFSGGNDDPDFSPDEVKTMQEKIGVLQGQLLIVQTFMQGLDGGYKKFLAAHPE
jgi:hypothetical protein